MNLPFTLIDFLFLGSMAAVFVLTCTFTAYTVAEAAKTSEMLADHALAFMLAFYAAVSAPVAWWYLTMVEDGALETFRVLVAVLFVFMAIVRIGFSFTLPTRARAWNFLEMAD